MTEVLRIADTTAWRLQRARLRWLARRLVGWVVLILVLVAAVFVASLWR